MLVTTAVCILGANAFAADTDQPPLWLQTKERAITNAFQIPPKQLDLDALESMCALSWGLVPQKPQEVQPELLDRMLSLRLRVLMEVHASRDSAYNIEIEREKVSAKVVPSNHLYPAGVAPADIKEPDVRKTYEAAIAENERRMAKLQQEMRLERLTECTLDHLRTYIGASYKGKASRARAIEVINASLPDQALREQMLKALIH